jgi:hypothetical protein
VKHCVLDLYSIYIRRRLLWKAAFLAINDREIYL